MKKGEKPLSRGKNTELIFSNISPPVCGGGLFIKGNRMKYEVRVGIKEVLGFHFDNLGDAVDFVFTCVENGYRATVISLEEGVENAI